MLGQRAFVLLTTRLIGPHCRGMDATNKKLSQSETKGALAGSPFDHLRAVLQARFSTDDFVSALRLVNEAGDAAEQLGHHPDIELGWGSAVFTLSSHDVGGVTKRDLELAERIAAIARELGAKSVDLSPTAYEIGIDTVDAAAIREFWKVAMGYEETTNDDGEVELVDPRGHGPLVWFQQMDPPRTGRNRIHLDSYVPAADAVARVHAVAAAGGTLVTDAHAPLWWVLADAEGNEVCICTT